MHSTHQIRAVVSCQSPAVSKQSAVVLRQQKATYYSVNYVSVKIIVIGKMLDVGSLADQGPRVIKNRTLILQKSNLLYGG